MTAPVIHQCPRCELRFSFRSEMEQHLRDDHPRPVSEQRQAAAKPAEVPIAPPPPLPVVVPVARPARSTRARLAAFVLAVIAVLAVAYVAVNVSLWSAALIAAAVLLLAVICVRRARGRPRLPRR